MIVCCREWWYFEDGKWKTDEGGYIWDVLEYGISTSTIHPLQYVRIKKYTQAYSVKLLSNKF